MSLLEKLKATPKVETKKASKNPSIILNQEFFTIFLKASSIEDKKKEISKQLVEQSNIDLSEISDIDAKIKALEGKKSMIQSRINTYAKQHYLSEYVKTGTQPENFNLLSEDGNSKCLYIVSDKYNGTDNIDTLIEMGVEEIVESTPTITVDVNMFIKYDKHITKFIETSKQIEDEDRDKFFSYSEKRTIKSGTLTILSSIAKKAKIEISELFELIKPTNYTGKYSSSSSI